MRLFSQVQMRPRTPQTGEEEPPSSIWSHVFVLIRGKSCVSLASTSTDLWHVQSGLTDGQLKDGPGPLHVPQDALQLGELDPGGAVLGAELQVLLVELPAAVKLPQLQLQLDVALQQLVLGTFTDGRALEQQTDVTRTPLRVSPRPLRQKLQMFN